MQATVFLSGLFSGWERGYLTIWGSDNKRTAWLAANELQRVESLCERSKGTPGRNLYFGCGIQGTKGKAEKRGEASGVVGIPGVWADIDFAEACGLKKSTKKYPPREIAEQAIERLPLKPSAIVQTGGGLHVYWLFHELLECSNDEDRSKAAAIVAGWQSLIGEHLRRLGSYEIDSTFDLARVLRIPGSWNYRTGTPVEVLDGYDDADAWRRYDVADLEQFAAEPVKRLVSQITELLIDTSANPPVEKLESLRHNSPEFRRVWDHKKDFPSNSERELSLASYCVQALWNDQEIANLIIAHRRRWEPEKLAKVTERKDYVANTIAKARGDASRDAALRLLNDDPAVDPEAASQRHGEADESKARQPAQRELTRDEILAQLSNVFGLPVAGWIQTGTERPIFSLQLVGGKRIEIGSTSEVLRNDMAFRAAIYSEIGTVMEHVPKKAWAGICESLAKIRELEDSEDLKEKTVARSGIDEYLRRKGYYEAKQRDVACIEGAAFVDDASVYVVIDSLIKWLNLHTGVRWDRRKLVNAMKSLGFECIEVAYSPRENYRTNRRYWRAKKADFEAANFDLEP